MPAERYLNKQYSPSTQFPDGVPCQRYWVTEDILVGGSIVDAADAEHLAKDFGITHVLSVESERDDEGRLSPFRTAARFAFQDVGAPIPPGLTLACIGFYQAMRACGYPTKLYLHCQMGGSRSPAIAYALVRSCTIAPVRSCTIDSSAALKLVRDGIGDPKWGENPHQHSYLYSIDECFK